MWISVSDTGVGMEEERLQQIRVALNDGTENEIGIGVGNIYRRVHGLYEDGEMFIYSKKGAEQPYNWLYTKRYRVNCESAGHMHWGSERKTGGKSLCIACF